MIRAALAFLLLLPAVANGCETLTYKSNDYTLCEVTLDDDLRLFHSDADGRLLGSFSRINAMLEQNGQTLGFAMNAGMYHADRSPVGLFIENGKERAPLADGGSYGNFGLKPNGVFCFGKDRLAVIETNAFRDARPACDYATQSGPMLVIDGALHPRFLVDATSRNIRNGVGVSADGTRAYFVISDNPVTFHEFGSLFRDHLKTPNALYFDGKVSRLFAPDLGRSDSGFPLGVIVGTVISR